MGYVNFQAADTVLGQSRFSSLEELDTSAQTTYEPWGPFDYINGKLYAPIYGEERVLIFDGIPTENGIAASSVLGQTDFVSTESIGTSAAPLQGDLYGPSAVNHLNDTVFITEFDGNRVSIYSSVPTSQDTLPTIVMGQTDFISNDTTCDAVHFDTPYSVATTNDGKLVIPDADHNRVLIWNTIPTANGQPADLVLGQADMISCDANKGEPTPSASTLSYPSGAWTDGTRLFVTDSDNHRVLIWNSFPTSNQQSADLVLGQADFESNTENDTNHDGVADDHASASTFNLDEASLHSDGTRLCVSDDNNNRVLIWNALPTEINQPADVVLGQSNFSFNTAWDDNQNETSDESPTARTFNYPAGCTFIEDKLILGEYNGGGRILIFSEQALN